MALTRNSRSYDRTTARRIGFALLCAAALAALIPAALYAGDAVRAVIFFLCGAVAGIMGVLAWPRSSADHDDTASPPLSRRAGADDSLSWMDIAEAMPEPAIILGRTAGILNYNAAARAIFDRLKQGLPLEHVNRDPEFIAAVASVFNTGERHTAKLRLRGGRGQRFIATITPLGKKQRPVTAALITVQDESEQHRLLEMRTDFIANASHELRTPLASVRGFIETLQGPARHDEAARHRFLAIMAEQAERMTRLIDDLLLLSRVEEKANLKPTGKIKLDELINEVVRAVAPAAAERQITVTVEPETSPLSAKGDRDELFQVFHNLIENAVKYGRDGGSVRIRLTGSGTADRGGKSSDTVTVTVTDDGPGIAPEHLPRLTERFYRVSAEHSRRIGGTGLGLAIAKHVLNRHDGELSVESVVGYGTTFKVILPSFK
jgi:two-component system phosphate regulon sensor histidine kinase PhoR